MNPRGAHLAALAVTLLVATGSARGQCFTEFRASSGSGPENITTGPDMSLWFTEPAFGGDRSAAGVVRHLLPDHRPESASQLIHERRRAVERGRGPEDVEVGTLEDDADVVLREPLRVAAVQVVDGRSWGHVGADASERREVRRQLGRETAPRIPHRAEQCEPAPDDVVEPAAPLAATHLALEEKVAGQRIAVREQTRAERGRR